MIAYYTIFVDGQFRGNFGREEKEDFVKNHKNKCHHLDIVYYNDNHRNIGCEEYIEGKLIYEYKEK